jgi:hypothetical protein
VGAGENDGSVRDSAGPTRLRRPCGVGLPYRPEQRKAIFDITVIGSGIAIVGGEGASRRGNVFELPCYYALKTDVLEPYPYIMIAVNAGAGHFTVTVTDCS